MNQGIAQARKLRCLWFAVSVVVATAQARWAGLTVLGNPQLRLAGIALGVVA